MLQRHHENITFLPVFHQRMEFAAAVRQALLAERPHVVAVEFPATWREPILQAANRLPLLSVILGQEGEEHLILTAEPTDPGMEALRTARELGAAVELIDLDVAQYPRVPEALPDPYAVQRLGYEAFLEQLDAHAAFPRHEQDEARETMMAHALQRVQAELANHRSDGRIACVLGAAHWAGVLERLAEPQPRPLARARARELTLYNWAQHSARQFMHEPPFLAAAYERWRDATRTAAPGEAPPPPDREADSERLLREAVEAHEAEEHERIAPPARRVLGRFAQKYARVDGLMVPDLFHLVTAARGVADDEFAYRVWQLGSEYPWQDTSGLLPSLDLDEHFAHVGGRRMTLHRKLKRLRPQVRNFAAKRRLQEQYGGRWQSQWSGRAICSFPPEDLVIEDYGRYLRHKAQALLSAERTRTEPFAVSGKDGIDVRETLRNWHDGRVYVREEMPLAGDVGAVVVIFEEDRDEEEAYPWRVTWLGEHEQESDMAFYATPAGEHLVGPGISRCEYGGLVMTYPPRRMFDVWSDPFFEPARSKPERLLMAGLDYAQQRHVLYVAPKPPRSWFRSIAGRLGKKLIHLPLGQLNPATLRRIRTFHVLDGQHVREYARDYIR